jgi:outer membrane immunogenic protein
MPTASRLSLATAILAGSIISASAADMPVAPPPPPVYNWSGLYLGFGIGVASPEAEWAFPNTTLTTTNHSWDDTRIQLHAGYQYMFGLGWGGIVLGVDLAAAFPLEDRIGESTCPILTRLCRTDFASLFTVGGKLGFAIDRFMIYGAGGYALADVNTRHLVTATGVVLASHGELQDGWYFGGGVDWAAYTGSGIDLILGFEYKHIEFDAHRHHLLNGLVDIGFTRDVTVTSDQFMAKATIKFGGLRWF